MGEVYRARDVALGREVAVELLPEDVATDEQRLARFEREARLLAQLNRPAIATLHGSEPGDPSATPRRPFLIMELVEGETLAERLRRGALPIAEALVVFRRLAEGLEAAHAPRPT